MDRFYLMSDNNHHFFRYARFQNGH